MKNKIMTIVEAVVIIALGIIIAVCGGGTALDIYFGIVAIVGGVALGVVAAYTLAKTKVLPFGSTFLSVALITVAIALFTGYLSFGILIVLVVYLILALGIALVLYGVYTLLGPKALVYAIVQIVVGVALAVLAIVFLAVPDFRTAFWIIVGILVAIYGALMLVSAFLPTKKSKQLDYQAQTKRRFNQPSFCYMESLIFLMTSLSTLISFLS